MKTIVKYGIACAAAAAPAAVYAADVNRPYLPPQPVAPAPIYAPQPCWAAFHMYRDGEGPSVIRRGPEAIPVIKRLSFDTGRSLNGRVLSVTTGPGATVSLFNGRRFRVPLLEVGPESVVNLARPVADSYRLECVTPYAAPPPGALK